MNEKDLSLLEQYDIKVIRTYRGRGSFVCETEQGILLFREYTGSETWAEATGRMLKKIQDCGYLQVDTYIQNMNGEILTKDKEGRSFLLKNWFEGKECDVKNKEEILDAVKNLAHLHQAMIMKKEEEQDRFVTENLLEEYTKHNREMKRVRSFIKTKRKKTDFEILFAKYFERFWEQAKEVENILLSMEPDKTCESVEKLCHGDYTQHNVLRLSGTEGMATVNFDKMCFGSQMQDLYLFMRKILEKHNWDLQLGEQIVTCYNKNKGISKEDEKQLFLRFSYPEKFWKLANHYYNSNKAWISGKSIEKLEVVALQDEEKEKFIRNLFSIS